MSAARLAAYGAPVAGVSFLLFFVQFYLLKFATDVLLLAPAAMGVLLGVGKVWDAVSDPLVGSWSDRSRFRLGRRRPFLLAALPLLVVGTAMVYAPPARFGEYAMLAWLGVGLLVFYTAFTLYTLPHLSLGAELSDEPHQRARLFGARQAAFTAGMFFAFAAMQLAMNAEAPRPETARIALLGALVACVVLLIPPLVLREPRAAGDGGRSLWSSLGDVGRSPASRRLLGIYFIESVGVGAVGAMTPYVADYLLRRPGVVGTLPAVYVAFAVISIPLWVRLSKRFGKRETWLVAMAIAAASFAGMLTIGEGDVLRTAVLLAGAGFAMGCGGVLAPTLLADVIDLEAKRSGERKEGVYYASMTFVLKIGAALATVLGGVVLSLAAFVPNAVQSAETLWAIRLLFAGLPCAGFVVAALILRGFTLEREAGYEPEPGSSPSPLPPVPSSNASAAGSGR